MPVTGSEPSDNLLEEELSGTEAMRKPATTGKSSGPTSKTRSSMDATLTHEDRTTVKEREAALSSSVCLSRSKAELKSKRRELELRIQISQEKIALAEAEKEILRLEKEIKRNSAEDEPYEREEGVRERVKSHMSRISSEGHSGLEGSSTKGRLRETLLSADRFNELLDPSAEIKNDINSREEAKGSDMDALAIAILKAIDSAQRQSEPLLPPPFMYELPEFDGSCEKWLAFKTVYEDTQALFSDVQNMTRLRKAVKGTAEEAVKSVLYSDCQPEEVMESLRRRFGRPEILVIAELEKLKNLPKVTENPQDVCVLASMINNTVAAIRGLKKAHYQNSPEMIRVIIEKLPMIIRYRWFDFAADHEDPDLALMAMFLNREADRCEPYVTLETTAAGKKANRQATHVTVEADEQQHHFCEHCEKNHHIEDCKKFQEASVSDRWDIAKKTKLCFKCLRGRHRKESCRKPSCKRCQKGHHRLLHEEREPMYQQPEGSSEKKEVAANCHLKNQRRAYLKMVPVEIYGPKGKVQILALLDEGSTVTLLDQKVADKVGLSGLREPLFIETVGGRVIKNDNSMRINMKLKGLHSRQKRQISGARTIEALRLMPQKIDKARLKEYAHLQKIVDKLLYKEKSPKLLIGQDNWEMIASRTTRKGKRGQPVASLTHLGWVLHGTDGEGTLDVSYVTCAHVKVSDQEMSNLKKERFVHDSSGRLSCRSMTDAEEFTAKLLAKDTRRRENERFEKEIEALRISVRNDVVNEETKWKPKRKRVRNDLSKNKTCPQGVKNITMKKEVPGCIWSTTKEEMHVHISTSLGGECTKSNFDSVHVGALALFVARKRAKRTNMSKLNPTNDAIREIQRDLDKDHQKKKRPDCPNEKEENWLKARSTRYRLTGAKQQAPSIVQMREYGTHEPSRFSQGSYERTIKNGIQIIEYSSKKPNFEHRKDPERRTKTSILRAPYSKAALLVLCERVLWFRGGTERREDGMRRSEVHVPEAGRTALLADEERHSDGIREIHDTGVAVTRECVKTQGGGCRRPLILSEV